MTIARLNLYENDVFCSDLKKNNNYNVECFTLPKCFNRTRINLEYKINRGCE